MSKNNHDLWLRIGFGIFLAIWGIDRVIRAKYWATESLMGHFYGEMGMMTGFVVVLGIVQIILAISLFTNYQVRITSLVLITMLLVSTLVTIRPLITYLINGGNPVPSIIFSDHFPLLAGAWAIFAHSREAKKA